MPWCPFAEDRRLPEWKTEPEIKPRALIFHSIVGSLAGADSHFRYSTSVEAHFGVGINGAIWQWQDTGRQADANYKANDFAISVETEDNGNPDQFPWQAPAQLEAMVRLGLWVLDTHSGIARQRCDSPYGTGIGFHTMWGAPSAWTPVNKSCPGAVRKVQFEEVLLPALLTGQFDEETDLMITSTSPNYQIKRFQQILNWHREQLKISLPAIKHDGAWGPNTERLWQEVAAKTHVTAGTKGMIRGVDYLELRLELLEKGHEIQHGRLKRLETLHPKETH